MPDEHSRLQETRDLAVQTRQKADSLEKRVDDTVTDVNTEFNKLWLEFGNFRRDVAAKFFWATCLLISTLVASLIQLVHQLVKVQGL